VLTIREEVRGMATVVTIGRNVGDTPMEAGQWASFRYLLELELRFRCGEVYFSGSGKGNSGQWGAEDAHCVVAAEVQFGDQWEELVKYIAFLGEFYRQEAIAVQGFYTGGTTVFV
jgi:hypothetical protein